MQRRNGYLDALREAGLSDAWLRSVPATRRGGYQATLELLRLPEPPTAIITDCNTHGDGAAMALDLRRLTGDNRVALVVYDGLPQDSIIETDVAAVIQSTRQGRGKADCRYGASLNRRGGSRHAAGAMAAGIYPG